MPGSAAARLTGCQRSPDGDSNVSENKKAYEFYMLQWDTYDAPQSPAASSDPFVGKAILEEDGTTGNVEAEPPLPRTATVIFTPLGEYKLRQTYAAPHLALTFYPDLSHTHGLVLLRGELTSHLRVSTKNPVSYYVSTLAALDAAGFDIIDTTYVNLIQAIIQLKPFERFAPAARSPRKTFRR